MHKRAVVLFAVLAVAGILSAQGESRLQVDFLLGEVVSNFSATARVEYVNPEVEAEAGDLERIAGIAFDYRLFGEEGDDWRLYVVGEVIHSARILEQPCSEDDPDCQEAATGDPGTEFFKLVKDASTLEWYGGGRIERAYNDGETGLYLKAIGGFIRAEGADDDVIDNHFVGLGVRSLEKNVWENSFAEVGWGRTDLFAEDSRKNRGKIRAHLRWTPGNTDDKKKRGNKDGDKPDDKADDTGISNKGDDKADDTGGNNKGDDKGDDKGQSGRGPITSYFLEGLLDSDFGPGSDDIQIRFGISINAGTLFDAFN